MDDLQKKLLRQRWQKPLCSHDPARHLQVDPEAAKVVFESGVAVVMVPLEVTHTALATPQIIDRITTANPSPFLLIIREILLFFSDTYRTVFYFKDPPIHDPCAIFYIIQPGAFKVCFACGLGSIPSIPLMLQNSASLTAYSNDPKCDLWSSFLSISPMALKAASLMTSVYRLSK